MVGVGLQLTIDCYCLADVLAATAAGGAHDDVVAIALYLIIKTSLHPWNNYVHTPAFRHVASELMRCSVNKAFRIP